MCRQVRLDLLHNARKWLEVFDVNWFTHSWKLFWHVFFFFFTSPFTGDYEPNSCLKMLKLIEPNACDIKHSGGNPRQSGQDCLIQCKFSWRFSCFLRSFVFTPHMTCAEGSLGGKSLALEQSWMGLMWNVEKCMTGYGCVTLQHWAKKKPRSKNKRVLSKRSVHI